MIHGLTITEGPEDWQILQHQGGSATVRLKGTWQLHPEAIEIGVAEAHPMARVLGEDDGYPVIPWRRAVNTPGPGAQAGEWEITLELPAGGPYRIETGLDTISTQPGLAWVFRGDVRLHLGVGDVFLISGQSNASGFGRDNACDPPDTRVHLFRNRGSWDLACHPLNEATGAADAPNADRGVGGSSPYLAFGRQFANLSHRPVGLIPAALGGMPIRRWDTRQDGSLYENMLARVRASGARPAGLLWYQGESDGSPADALTTEEYLERFGHMVRQLRAELGYDIPVFTLQLNRELLPANNAGWGQVREAQRRAAREIPGVYVLPTTDCSLADGVHNSGHSNLRLGERLARQCGGVLYGTAPLAAPDIAQAQAKGATLTLRFAGLVGELTLRTGDVGLCGLTVEDGDGEIAVAAVRTDKQRPDVLEATLARAPGAGACVSYAWQGNPTFSPALDNATFLPPLSFYRFPITS